MDAGQFLEVAADRRGLLQLLRDHAQLGEQVGDRDALPPLERLRQGGRAGRQQAQQGQAPLPSHLPMLRANQRLAESTVVPLAVRTSIKCALEMVTAPGSSNTFPWAAVLQELSAVPVSSVFRAPTSTPSTLTR